MKTFMDRRTFLKGGLCLGAAGVLGLRTPAWATPTSSPLIRSPWLQAATQRSIYVLVETEKGSRVQVEYGPTEELGLTAEVNCVEKTIPGREVNNLQISGLKPDTGYYYRAVVQGSPTPIARFKTASPEGAKVNFAWVADTRTGTDVHQRVAGLVKEAKPEFSLYGGDMAGIKKHIIMDEERYEIWGNEFFLPREMDLIAQVPFYLAPGNHDCWSGMTRAFVQSPECDSGKQDYYSFDWGNVHVLALNSEMDLDPDSPQARFAADDLAKSKAVWKIVIIHRPAYTGGLHKGDKRVIALSKGVFAPQGVTMVLSAHNHFYQHSHVDGVDHLIIGSAGAPLYNPSPAPFIKKSIKTHCYGLFEADPQGLILNVFDGQGRQIDQHRYTRS